VGVARRPVAALGLGLLTACTLFGPRTAEVTEVSRGDLIAVPDGQVVLVGQGEADDAEWSAYAFVSGGDACISTRFAPFGEAGECGPAPEADPIGPLANGPPGDTVQLFGGIVSSQVASVRYVYADGQVEDAVLVSIERAGIDAKAYAATFADDRLPERFVLADESGETLAELGLSGP
jgi:hypothetical protein